MVPQDTAVIWRILEASGWSVGADVARTGVSLIDLDF